jgi:allantoicase
VSNETQQAGHISIASAAQLPDWALQAVNLAEPRIGAEIVACSDDFFAPAARMLHAAPAVFITGKYDDNGKWMDGWESRRRRDGGYDWCIVKLGRPGTLAGVDIDTSFFTGNYPPMASLEGCIVGTDSNVATSWQSLIAKMNLNGNSHHVLPINSGNSVYSHVRINIFPDGGIARLRVYGHISPAAIDYTADGHVDLIALTNGGRAVAWNDAHFGAVANMLLPGRGADMGEGWETRRRREPGHDWCVIALALAGTVERIEIDTAHFKGNFPHRVSLQAAYLPGATDDAVTAQSAQWPVLLTEQFMQADHIHYFAKPEAIGPITHVRLNLFPDGGVSRLRLWGLPEAKP